MPGISDSVKVVPGNAVALKVGSPAEVGLKNTGKEVVTFKLKTTRPLSVRPSRAWGVMPPGGDATLRVNFMPTAQEKPFEEADHITVLVGTMPDKNMKPEDFWRSKAAIGAHRFVLKLSEIDKPVAPKKKKTGKEETQTSEDASVASGAESERTTDSESDETANA